MSKIKQYFRKKKDEAAFKLKLGGSLGQGHSLTSSNLDASCSQNVSVPGDKYDYPTRKEMSSEAKAAAAAALSRIEKKDQKSVNSSLANIRAQARREMEAEKVSNRQEIEESTPDCKRPLVLFRCPIVSNECLPKAEWKDKIKEFLNNQLDSERALTSCLIIRNCNSKEKASECVGILIKYLENLINHPNEEKYCTIRMSNRIFNEKVRFVEGAIDFLHACGFQEVEMEGEPFLIWCKDNIEHNYDLPTLLESLKAAEPIQLELDRNIKVLLPSQAKNFILPDDFYRITPDEIQRERQIRIEAIENSQILKTKAMREREEQQALRMYKYALVRVKFPDGIYIEGTFDVYEKICDVMEFVQSCLQDETMDFFLIDSKLGRLNKEFMDKTLYDLRLIPNVVLLFNAPTERMESNKECNIIKDELLLLIQNL